MKHFFKVYYRKEGDVKVANTTAYPFYAVMEEAPTGEAQRFEIIGESSKSDTGVNYLEWRQCLLVFNKFNRNRRWWGADHFRKSLMHPWISQLFAKGGVPGEQGHPTPDCGKLSLERLYFIDPNRTCLLLKNYEFDGDKALYGTIQTLDDGEGGPGDRLRRNILQGIIPSVSVRSVVPQRKNPDGSITVIGPGRIVCWDRVYYPSDDQAFADTAKPFKITNKNVKVSSKMGAATEAVNMEIPFDDLDFTSYYYNKSEACKRITDGLDVAMESASIDSMGIFSVMTSDGHLFIPMEEKLRSGIKDLMRKW